MKEIEITIKVNDTLESTIKKLENCGFELIESLKFENYYATMLYENLNLTNIIEVLKSCVIIRSVFEGEKVYNYIIYKNKTYENDQVIFEELIRVVCDNSDNAKKLFKLLGFEKIADLNYNFISMKKGDIKIYLQNVENLGLFLEYEINTLLDNNEKIIKQKELMIEQIKSYGLNLGEDYEVNKVYEIIKNNLQNRLEK